MNETLRIIFDNPFSFFGTLILLGLVSDGIVNCCRAFRRPKP